MNTLIDRWYHWTLILTSTNLTPWCCLHHVNLEVLSATCRLLLSVLFFFFTTLNLTYIFTSCSNICFPMTQMDTRIALCISPVDISCWAEFILFTRFTFSSLGHVYFCPHSLLLCNLLFPFSYGIPYSCMYNYTMVISILLSLVHVVPLLKMSIRFVSLGQMCRYSRLQ